MAPTLCHHTCICHPSPQSLVRLWRARCHEHSPFQIFRLGQDDGKQSEINHVTAQSDNGSGTAVSMPTTLTLSSPPGTCLQYVLYGSGMRLVYSGEEIGTCLAYAWHFQGKLDICVAYAKHMPYHMHRIWVCKGNCTEEGAYDPDDLWKPSP